MYRKKSEYTGRNIKSMIIFEMFLWKKSKARTNVNRKRGEEGRKAGRKEEKSHDVMLALT